MKPVFQTITDHNPSEGRFGNCVQAAVASLLELPIDAVPHFCDGLDGDNKEETRRINAFLRERGETIIDIAFAADKLDEWIALWEETGTQFFHLISGTSPRGFFHCCVGLNGRVVHDPHPSGGGVSPRDGLLFFSMIVPHAALATLKGDK